ncbi:MAG: amidase family protein [Bacteroidota bacterium]
MKRFFLILSLGILIVACKQNTPETNTDAIERPIEKVQVEVDTSSTEALDDVATEDFREFKVLDSEHLTKEAIWQDIDPLMTDFTQADHDRLKSLILEQDIPTLQTSISGGDFSYEELTKFYLFRIRTFDRENALSLNSVISINPSVIEDAKQADLKSKDSIRHPIFGMPILLKDNIDTSGMATTAGAVALMDNHTEDAFVVSKLKSKGALILGKANLSEWAYFFCGDCPSGYSAVGGQTLNPYGRRKFDTGGSSSGSAVAVAANFCIAAIGSETSGSILSPSSQNSTVGLKPSIGLISRSGIVPISSTLDTAGPITRNVIDNAIVLDAAFGEDELDSKSFMIIWDSGFYYPELAQASLQGKRFAAPKRLMEDSLFVRATEDLEKLGAEIVEIDEVEVGLPNFIRLLNLDMKRDLPKYMETFANDSISLQTITDIVNYNSLDSAATIPYGQRLFRGIIADSGTDEDLKQIRDTLKANGQMFFNEPMRSLQLNGFLSINNYHAGYAAVGEFPAITVPMGYGENGQPKGLTIISNRLKEKMLLEWAYVYEQATMHRRAPKDFN